MGLLIRFAGVGTLLLTVACAPDIPDSNPYSTVTEGGVGFGEYDTYEAARERREAELRQSAVPESQVIASETIGVLEATSTNETVSAAQNGDVEPLGAPNNPDISDEQNFDAVSSRETIESDAERLARLREQYTVIQPEAVPDRPSGSGPNIVAFALSTSNRVGEARYDRSGSVNLTRFNRICSEYASSDQAQQAFLAAGGPERDRRGVDPDGDGFACFWDPTPFRNARGGA